MKTKLFTLFTALCCVCVVYASNVITYTADEKLSEITVTDGFRDGLHLDAFNVDILSHTFDDGQGTITFVGEVTSIDDEAFYHCSGLTSITIPNSVTYIGSFAFIGCRGLISITIPNSVTEIGDYTFVNCSGLTSVTIPNSVMSIGLTIFRGCSELTTIIVGDENTKYDSRNNCNALIETTTNTLIAGCYNTVIPNSVTSIGRSAFYGCSGLTSITIPNSVTSIGRSAFYGCSGLTSITIPNSVTSIGDDAFADCSGLTSVTCLAPQVPTADESSFRMCIADTLYVLADLVDEYKNAEGWNVFTNILPLLADSIKIVVDELQVEATPTTATFTWPTVVSAVSYELVIKKDGVVFCTLTFNESGQLTGIAFAPSKTGEVQSTGFKFTVTGLDEACLYSYNFDAKDSGGNVLKNYSGTFSTDGYVGVKQVTIPGLYAENGRVVCENAQDLHIYTLTGVDVTRMNGHLQGVYIVKCGEQTQKVVVR